MTPTNSSVTSNKSPSSSVTDTKQPPSEPSIEQESTESVRLAKVVFSRRNIEEPFTYAVDGSESVLGLPVVVPLGPSLTVGVVVDVEQREEVPEDVKPVRDVLDGYLFLPEPLIELGKWMADYYVAPLNKVFESIMPPKFLPSPSTAWRVTGDLNTASEEEVQDELIDRLDPDSRVDLDTLHDGCSLTKSEIKEQMERLEESELVKETLSLGKPDVSRRTLNYVEPSEWPDNSNELTDKAEECLEYVHEQNGCFQKDLPDSLGRSDLLSRLEGKGHIERGERVVRRDPFPDQETEEVEASFELTEEQADVIESVRSDWDRDEFHTHMIHGVTGSGKTEVYFRLANQAMDRGETVLVLVPEITLAAFMVKRFRQRFGDDLALLHSGLSAGERLDEWIRILEGDASVVLGVQSAVFAPLENLGLVVVDEEHDSSYKAGRTPRYHARDVAVKRAQQAGVPVLLGSATPSLESYSNALKDRYELNEMTERPLGGELPDVNICDLRNHDSPVTESLLEKTKSVLDRDRKAIWFMNRRGHSNFLLCEDCGEVVECRNCDVSLTFHSNPSRLQCHYCGYSRSVPDQCPNCRGTSVDRVGMGTQHLESVAEKVFEGIDIIRMDTDTVSRKQARFEKLNAFGEASPALLIGTQMVTKGLDFGGVDFVGVLNVDTGLHLPDFRAAEYTFQQLVQVCGRAGREQAGAEVLVQTYNPGHYAIQLGARQSYRDFFEKECSFRKPLEYPPYARLINIVSEGQDEDAVARELNELREVLERDSDVDLLGPAPCGMSYVKGKYRWHLMARGWFSPSWRQSLRQWVIEQSHDANLTLDVDPVDVM
jgi:primosomal protein N' (replication factor Y)